MKKTHWSLLFLCLSLACSDDPEPIDCSASGPIISLGVVTQATSCSTANGSLQVSATGGKQPYSFSIGGTAQPEGKFENLSAGVYTVSVTDANACSAFVENVSIKASDFTFATELTGDSDCLGANGQVKIIVEPTHPPYMYRRGTGSFVDNNIFTELPAGSHAFTVKDGNGCSVNLMVTVPRAQSGTSWENDIRPIIVRSCASSGCHNGSSRADLRVFENAKAQAARIKSRTQDRSMPREGTLAQSEIDLIACWVDDGALMN